MILWNLNTVLSLVIFVANNLTLPSSMSVVNVHKWICVRSGVTKNGDVGLRGAVSTWTVYHSVASTISNLLLVVSDIEMWYLALL